MSILHPDWTPVDEYTSPSSDVRSAFEYHGAAQQTATPVPGQVERPVGFDDLAAVVRYAVSYHDTPWKPGDDPGTELVMCVVARTTDDRWVAIEAWNDYTGWDCQDGADIRVGGTEDQVVRYGLSDEARARLGYNRAVPS